jgi:ribosomal protein L24
VIVRLEPVAAFDLLLIEDVTVGDVVLILAGSDRFGAGRVQEATRNSVNVKETARRPNSQ